MPNFIKLLFNVYLYPMRERERKGVDLVECESWKYMGSTGGRETIMRIYCMKKIYFQLKLTIYIQGLKTGDIFTVQTKLFFL